MDFTNESHAEPMPREFGDDFGSRMERPTRAWLAEWSQRAVALLGSAIKEGRLDIEADSGEVWRLGQRGPHARIRVRDASVLPRILLHPTLRLGEAYMDGDWAPAGDLLSVFEVAMCVLRQIEGNPLIKAFKSSAGRWVEANDPRRSQRNVAQHYDLDADFFRLFLDEDLHYSCAYYGSEDSSLEQAQLDKRAHIARKLNLRRGARVLDIGCGWGSLALYLAEKYEARVLGITLSKEQHRVACARARERGLSDRVEFRLEDYRQTQGRYDAIVSVGMFEHVGRPQYAQYFAQMHALLADHGTALLHTIGRSTPPGGTNPWINKYIFPGGYVPAASEVLAPIERSGLLLDDLEVLRMHYAYTLRDWHTRFQARRKIAEMRYGERFCRMWEFYLQGCEAAFRWSDLVVFQFQLTRQLQRLPLQRDYLYAAAGSVRARSTSPRKQRIR